MGSGCAVVISKPGAEFEAEAALRRRGYRVFLPLYRKQLRAGHAAMRPLFPHYGFVMLDDAEAWIPILSTPGVDDIVRRMGSHDEPALLTAELVAAIRSESDAGAFDDRVPAPIDAVHAKAGDRVRIAEGPFQSFITTLREVDDRGRARALLRLFDRDVPAELDLRRVAVAVAPQRVA